MTDSQYSPRRRTALVLSGTGTAGAYHAGVLMALNEAGVKIDLVAGRGIGAVATLFGAVDGGGRLWEPNGLWRTSTRAGLYRFRWRFRLAGWALLGGLAVLFSPLALLGLAVVVYLAGLVVTLVGLSDLGDAMTSWFSGILASLFAPTAVPTVMPRLVTLALVTALAIFVGDELLVRLRGRRRRRMRDAAWWRLAGAPLSADRAVGRFRAALWRLIRGAALLDEPPPVEIGRRYTELALENLGQPGFREAIVAAHDLDIRQDVVFALLAEPHRQRFFSKASRVEGAARTAEAFDLAGASSDHVVDALAAALTLPVITDPHVIAFAPESYWRGEAHRMCDRPDALTRLLDETAAAGAEQVVVVSDAPPPGEPHGLAAGRTELRARAGEVLRAMETAAVGDALRSDHQGIEGVFVIRPSHNPVGPFDFGGAYDERSDRVHRVSELVDRGYEDAYRQFIEPVVGASGDSLATSAGRLEGAGRSRDPDSLRGDP